MNRFRNYLRQAIRAAACISMLGSPLAAAAVLGVLAGSRAGLWISPRAKARWLKLLMAGVLAAVSVAYFYRSVAS